MRLLSGSRPPAQARIEIGLPGGSLDAGLSGELCSAFGPKHAFTFDFPTRMSPHCGGAWARRGPGADGHHHPRTRRTAWSPTPAWRVRARWRVRRAVLPCGVEAGLRPELVLINDQNFSKTSHCWGQENNVKGTNTNRIVLFR